MNDDQNGTRRSSETDCGPGDIKRKKLLELTSMALGDCEKINRDPGGTKSQSSNPP